VGPLGDLLEGMALEGMAMAMAMAMAMGGASRADPSWSRAHANCSRAHASWWRTTDHVRVGRAARPSVRLPAQRALGPVTGRVGDARPSNVAAFAKSGIGRWSGAGALCSAGTPS
jgi:hypothetical protein